MKTNCLKTLLILPFMFSITACGTDEQKEYVTLPDLYNMTVKEAKLEVGANILFTENKVSTSELIEGRILSYGNDLKVGDKVEKGTRVEINVSKRSETAIDVDSDLISYINQINMTTGPNSSQNKDVLLNAGAKGTDLGIPFLLPDGKIMLLYGDTFSGDNMSGMWKSNFMAISSDFTLYDGLTFDSVVTNDYGAILPFAEGLHHADNETDKNSEVTKIPTGGISIGDNVYIFYMSIRYWGVSGSWLVTYNQCVKATDNTYTKWENVPSLRWNDDELYSAGQIYPFYNPQDTNNIYFTSIPGGRNDGAIMFRVNKNNFENRDEYEYLVAEDTWVKGDEGMKSLHTNPYYILSPGVAEPSIMYSSYLNKWIYSTLKGTSICFALSDSVTGPYKEIYTICNASNFAGLYGGFVNEKYTDSNGQRIYIQLSQWVPIYNTSLVEVVLK